jgi:hypothetical protein
MGFAAVLSTANPTKSLPFDDQNLIVYQSWIEKK